MTHPRAPLGDSHNFGRRVTLTAGRVYKPRTLFWERLLLARDSPLRKLLAKLAEQDGLGPQALGFLPTLEFVPDEVGPGGQVQRLTLQPLPRMTPHKRRQLAVIVGRSLALWSWLGAADLHWENLVLGVDARGHIVFGPLDVEMLLADLSLPTETKLLPDPDPEYAELCRHAAGVRRVLPYLGKPLAVGDLLSMAGAYRSLVEFLERHAAVLTELLARLPGLSEAPIRVLLRSTAEYVNATSSALWPPLLRAEAEQLERGDIPYFFRFYGKKGIYFYANEALTEVGRLPLRGDVPQLEPLLDLAGRGRPRSRLKLLQDGFFTVLGAFDHASLQGTHEVEGLQVHFGARSLRASFADGEELRTSRNLRDFVSSVYLPCRCGEVRSVFVPPLSTCTGS